MTTDEEPVALVLDRASVRLLDRGFRLGLLAEARTTGAEPSLASSALLARLDAAARGQRFADEPPFTPPATVDTGLKEVLAAAEVAAQLGCTPKHVRTLCRGGHFPNARRVAGTWHITAADLHAFRLKRWERARGIAGPTSRERAADGR
ncbi:MULTISPECIES: helix-turn-helix domain-containing protein [unclassified Streptomyces]|uniref:helix-turn-helix domain-containing protein n=1 Tax=unclassified Streptomyces TaxID=2593676 RepID=UPI002E193357